MRAIPLFVLAAVSCALSWAQGISCTTVDSGLTTIRVEGRSELLPDIVVRCTGGTPAASASAVSRYQILVITNTPLANKLVPLPAVPTTPSLTDPLPGVLQWNDALLLLDEPTPANQMVCVPADGSDSCATNGFNVFQGQQLQANAVIFQKVPIDAPGPGKTRTIRIANLRVDATQIPAKPLPAQVHVTTQVFDPKGNLVPISGAELITGDPQPSYKFAIRTASDGATDPLTPVLTVTPAMVPQNNPTDAVSFNVKFSEQFAGAFKRRNAGTNGSDPSFLTNQADPGAAFHTETGFFNSAFPLLNNLSSAGLADSGTRLRITFTGIPDNVRLWVTGRDVPSGTTNYDVAAPHAVLIYSDDDGGLPFSQNLPPLQGFSEIWPTNGVTTLVWEVVAADPAKLEDFSFNVRLVAPNGIPSLGTATLHASLAPIYPGLPGVAQPAAAPAPSFLDDPSDPVVIFRIVPTLNQSSLTVVSSASYSGSSVAPGSVVSAFATNLTTTTATSSGAPVAQLAGVSANVIDNIGNKRAASLYMASPGVINMVVDPNTQIGDAVVNVTRGTQLVATGNVKIAAVAPGLYSAHSDGAGLAAGSVVYVSSGGNRTVALGTVDVPTPVVVDSSTELAVLALYGTGIRGRSDISNVHATVGGEPVAVNYAGAQGQFAGLDQVNIGPLPRDLAGKGDVPVILTVDGKQANPLTVRIK